MILKNQKALGIGSAFDSRQNTNPSWLKINKPKDVDIIAIPSVVEKLKKVYPEVDKSILPYYDKSQAKRRNRCVLQLKKDVYLDIEIAAPGTSGELILKNEDGLENEVIQSLIRESHKYKWSKKFDQHINRQYIKVDNKPYWYKLREEETYNKKHKLNVKAKDFFTSNVKYYVNHDDLHEALAIIHGRPAYKNYLKDGEEVLCDEAKFNKCSSFTRDNGVIEESLVLAYERVIIPMWMGGKLTNKTQSQCQSILLRAAKESLQRVCGPITSGWFREYARHNYWSLLGRMESLIRLDVNINVDTILKKILDGEIMPYEKEEQKPVDKSSQYENKLYKHGFYVVKILSTYKCGKGIERALCERDMGYGNKAIMNFPLAEMSEVIPRKHYPQTLILP